MLQCRVLGRLLQVAVHVAGGREDALDAGRRGRRREVLLDHVGERRPPGLLGPEARDEEQSITTTRKGLKGIAEINNVGIITYRVEFRQWLYPVRHNRKVGLIMTRRRLDETDS